jgi:hypothetical protein
MFLSYEYLHYKLQNAAKDLKAWSKLLFGNARGDLHLANEIIKQLDVAQETRLLSDDEHHLCKEMKIRTLGIATIE